MTTAEALMEHVVENTSRQVIVSYMTLNRFSDIGARRASGYVSDLTEQQIVNAFVSGGFVLQKRVSDPLDATDTIYLFEKA